MKDNEKQIEEMASDMDYGCTKRDLYPDDAKEIAKALYLLGYRKLPEDSVVLSRAKYEMLVACSSYEGVIGKLKDEYIRGSKETAEKIFNSIFKLESYDDGWNELYYKDHIIQLAKQFGVEIKE